jgi:hypothetical protein
MPGRGGSARADAGARRRDLAVAASLPARRGPLKLESRFWGTRVFHDVARDAEASTRALQRCAAAEERRDMAAEECRARAQEADALRRDYFELVRLINRYGPCPGELFCTTRFPGREYAAHVSAAATTLVCWWRRRRVRRLGRR